MNFAFRGACNRCGSARPAGASGVAGGGGRGRGRSGPDAGGIGRPAGATAGLFGPNDWPCPMCGNINWAKRLKCNICNTNKPGHNEGGVRGGRAGGYKELDEEEIELDLTYNAPGARDYIHKGGMKRDVPLLEDVVVIEGAGHFIHQERADKINKYIYDFFKKF